MSPDNYVSLESDPGIDAKIKAKDGELVALRRSEEIEAKALLARVDIPTLPSALPTVLAKELDNVSAFTEQLVHEHMEGHTNRATEPWLAQGTGFEKSNECPFCGLSMDGNDLVAAYRTYFGDTYKALKEEVATLRNDVSAFGNERMQLLIRQTLQSKFDLKKFWK